MNHLRSESAKAGLKININKTETMRINNSNSTPFTIDSQNVKDVNKFNYLGSIITTSGGTLEDVDARLQKAKSAFARLRNIWRTNNIALNTKIKIFNVSNPYYCTELKHGLSQM